MPMGARYRNPDQAGGNLLPTDFLAALPVVKTFLREDVARLLRDLTALADHRKRH
jgi:hypothetical protein